MTHRIETGRWPLAVLLLGLGVPGCKQEPPPAGAEVVAPVLGAREEVDAGEPVDAGGPVAVLEKQALTLGELGARERAVLERHLRSSARWEVSEERFTSPERVERKAVLREDPHDTASLERGQVSVQVLLGEPGTGAVPEAGTGPMVLPLREVLGGTGWESKLSVGLGAGLTLEVSETSEDTGRRRTKHALEDVLSELSGALVLGAEIETKGYARSLVPEGSVEEKGKPRLVVEDDFQGGLYVATGWVNPGEEGVCFLRIFYAGHAPGLKGRVKTPRELWGKKGKPLSAELMELRTSRLVGWGPAEGPLFRYRARATLYEGGFRSRYMARFELWFRDRKGHERKLAEATEEVTGWQR